MESTLTKYWRVLTIKAVIYAFRFNYPANLHNIMFL